MKPLRVELMPRRPPGRLAWGFAALCWLAAVGVAGAAWHTRQALEQAQEASARAAAEAAERRTAPRPALEPPYARSAREMLNERAFPWPGVFTTLENVALVGVTPVSVDMDARAGVARVEVSFTEYRHLLVYLESLNAGETRMPWRLVQARMAQAGVGTATFEALFSEMKTATWSR